MAKRFDQAAPGPSQRQQRVGELVRHALAEVLARGGLQDEVLSSHSVTIPEVRMSPDLRLATAYVMPLGGQDEGTVLNALIRNRKILRQEVARRVHAALLVAPADPERRAVLGDFAPVPYARLPYRSIVVACSNDPYCPARLAGA